MGRVCTPFQLTASKPSDDLSEVVPTIDKPLFEAGLQCAKRLCLEYDDADSVPKLSAHRERLIDVGEELVRLASQIFPGGLDLRDEEFEAALQKTEAFLAQGRPGVLFHAAFRGAGVEARADIVLVTTPGKVDLFEVKAGTTIKPRHLTDVALQMHAIEASGHEVQSCAIVHLDPRYVHDGSKDYKVQKLFRNVDVTTRARNQLGKMFGRLQSFRSALDDETSMELPTGTWCKRPLPCHFLKRCLKEAPDYPLVELPQLNRVQESRFHEDGIESIDQLDAASPGLTRLQRRAIQSVHSGELVVEPFVPREVDELDRPIAFLHIGWHLEVLPTFDGSRPWHKLPFCWSIHWLNADGSTTVRSYASRSAEDPRDECLSSLADQLARAETVIVYSWSFDDRFRALLEDDVPSKSHVRAISHAPVAFLEQLLMHGVYHPGFRGNFDVWNVHDTLEKVRGDRAPEDLSGWDDGKTLEIRSEDEAQSAMQRILNRRTRQATRQKLGDQLEAWSRRSSAALVRIVEMLRATEGETIDPNARRPDEEEGEGDDFGSGTGVETAEGPGTDEEAVADSGAESETENDKSEE